MFIGPGPGYRKKDFYKTFHTPLFSDAVIQTHKL